MFPPLNPVTGCLKKDGFVCREVYEIKRGGVKRHFSGAVRRGQKHEA
jgi:hypothetical protein